MRAPALYWLDFWLYPALAIGAAILACRSWAWCGLALTGFVLFTLAEYWTHRLVLHRYFYHGTHERHHKHPREFVVFHWSLIPAGFAVLFVLLPASLVAGFALGWFWFCVCHHAMHHWNGDWVYRWSRWHDLHHRYVRCNFGITHPLWDVMFRTYRSL